MYVTVKYTVTAELNRGRMQQALENRVELIVEVPVRNVLKLANAATGLIIGPPLLDLL